MPSTLSLSGEDPLFILILKLPPSPWFWSPKNYTEDLGGIERNATGHVVGAKAIWVQILVEVGNVNINF